jgi:pilus assembly protein Flp/PilA
MSFIKDENGQGMVEYALIVALIAIVVIVALVFLGPIIRNKLADAGNNIP